MSRTYHHTTPAFPRSLKGPRGGQIIAPTPCADCVAFLTCRPGQCSAPFGCDSWVDFEGRRVDVEADNARLLASTMTEPDLAAVLGALEDGRPVDLARPSTTTRTRPSGPPTTTRRLARAARASPRSAARAAAPTSSPTPGPISDAEG